MFASLGLIYYSKCPTRLDPSMRNEEFFTRNKGSIPTEGIHEVSHNRFHTILLEYKISLNWKSAFKSTSTKTYYFLGFH